MNNRIIRFEKVKELTGLSRSTIWRLEKNKLFPKRIKITNRNVGWLLSEIEAWINFKFNQGGK